MSRQRTVQAVAALAVLAMSTAGGCSTVGIGSPGGGNPTATTTLRSRAHEPFTGLPAKGPLPKRPVLIVKIDNTPDAAPQEGLSSADMVVEELVEGGLTRLAAFYYSKIPGTVGPTRSVRTSDIGFVLPTHGLLIASGGGEPTLGRLKRDGIKTAFEGQLPGFYRTSSRPAPYNLMINLRDSLKAIPKAKPPTDYLPWALGRAKQLHGKRVTKLSVTFSPAHTTTWSYRPKLGWIRTNGLDTSSDRFVATNLLVLRVRIHQAHYVDPSGAPVPETEFVGTGSALLVHNEQAVTGQWKKVAKGTPLRLSSHGKRLRVPPGHTWIELVPTSGSVSTGH
jgi:hypothetical protein